MSAPSKLNQTKYAKLFKLLMLEPRTAHELAEAVNLHVVNTQGLMRTFKKHKVVHICRWERDRLGRDCTPVYKFGAGKNKARRKMTPAERTARYRRKKEMLALTNIVSLHNKGGSPSSSKETYDY
jgi:hypothetical protein